MPEYVPFRDVPLDTPFRFDKSHPECRLIRDKLCSPGDYYAEGGGLAYHCPDPERPCILLGDLQLVEWFPGEFGIINEPESDPYSLGYTKGVRWNGWACPVFPWESVLQIARDFNRGAYGQGPADTLLLVVDEENRRVWLDERCFMSDGDDPSSYYYEVEPDYLFDGTPVWGIGSGSWTWNDKRDFESEEDEQDG